MSQTNYSLSDLAGIYVQYHYKGAPALPEQGACCDTVTGNAALALHKRGFLHMCITYKLKRVPFRTEITEALNAQLRTNVISLAEIQRVRELRALARERARATLQDSRQEGGSHGR